MDWKKIGLFIMFVIVCSIPLFFTFNRGINYFDEGYIVEGARRILTGELPYRDFHFIYTPATAYFLSLFLRFGGNYLIVERICALTISIIGIIFLGLFVRTFSKNSILVFLTMFFYTLWGPAHLNFIWPVMIVLPLVFLYLFLLSQSHFFLAGIAIGVVLLTKQNFGVAVIISFFINLFWANYSRRQISMVFYGCATVVFLFIIHLFLTHSFYPFISDMNMYSIQEILIRRTFSTPFPTQSIGKFLLYAFPGMGAFALSIGIIMRKTSRPLLYIPLTFVCIYLFGIFPTPDWTHLLPLIGFSGIFFALFPRVAGKRYRFVSYILFFIFISTALYSLTIRNYYRWEAPLIKQTHCFSSGVMKYICIDEKNYAVVSQTLAFISSKNAKDTFLFSFYNNPIYYFLTGKTNPTPFIDFNVAIKKEEELNVIDKLQKKNVKVIITRFPPQNNQSKTIARYIEKKYTQTYSVYEFAVWEIKQR